MKKIALGFIIFIGAAAVFFVLVSVGIVLSHRGQIVSRADATGAQVAIVLGAKVKADGSPSDMLEDRLLTGIELYQTGKVEKLLLSGDDGQIEYDEVNAMREYVLGRGIPAEDIFLDHAGFDTYDSMARAGQVFGVTNAIIVSQGYHLPRALFLADSFGISVQGVAADRQTYRGIMRFMGRELFADVKAVFDVVVHASPTYLGDLIDITGDGRVTWDEE